jgi:hypothetical protein
MAIWQLSDHGRAMTWKKWRSLDSCGIPNSTCAHQSLGPEAHWPDGLTLGQIEDACPFTGRSLARYAKERMGRDEMVKPYQRLG